MSSATKQSPDPVSATDGATADSAKRIELLRQRLEQYNAAIAQAMGMAQQQSRPPAANNTAQSAATHTETAKTQAAPFGYHDQNVRYHFDPATAGRDAEDDDDDDWEEDEEYTETDDTEIEEDDDVHDGQFDSDAAAYFAERVLKQHLQRQHHQQESTHEAQAQHLRTQQFAQQYNSNNESAEFEEVDDEDAAYAPDERNKKVASQATAPPQGSTANITRNAQAAAAALASSHEFTELLKKWSPYTWQQEQAHQQQQQLQKQGNSAAAAAVPATTSRPLFPPDTYREGSEANSTGQRARQGPTSAAATMPPAPSPAKTTAAAPVNAMKQSPPEVNRCLSEELKATPVVPASDLGPKGASVANDTTLLANPELRATTNDFETGNTNGATTGGSPIPDAPDYTISDLENAFHRINAVEQSLHTMRGFPLQDAKLPFEDRIETLRATRVGLMEREVEAYNASTEVKRHLLPLSDKDEGLHVEIQALLTACGEKFDDNFKNVFGLQKFISQKEVRLEQKASDMQRCYANLQERRRQVEAIEDHNKRLTDLCESRRKVIVREKEEVKALSAKLKEKEKDVLDAEGKSASWLQMLQDRDALISTREERLATMEHQLEKRLNSIQAQKENRGHLGVNLGSGLYSNLPAGGSQGKQSANSSPNYPNTSPPPPPPLPSSAFEQQFTSDFSREAPRFRAW